MIIQVTQFVRINRDDSRNWTIQTMHIAESGKRRGEEIWRNDGYFGSIETAAAALMNDKIDLIIEEPGRLFNDLREFMDVMQAAQRKVLRAVRGTGRKVAKKAKNGDSDAVPEEAVPSSES